MAKVFFLQPAFIDLSDEVVWKRGKAVVGNDAVVVVVVAVRLVIEVAVVVVATRRGCFNVKLEAELEL